MGIIIRGSELPWNGPGFTWVKHAMKETQSVAWPALSPSLCSLLRPHGTCPTAARFVSFRRRPLSSATAFSLFPWTSQASHMDYSLLSSVEADSVLIAWKHCIGEKCPRSGCTGNNDFTCTLDQGKYSSTNAPFNNIQHQHENSRRANSRRKIGRCSSPAFMKKGPPPADTTY